MNNIQYEKIIDALINDKEILQSEIDSLKSLLNYWDLKKDEIIGKRVTLVSTSDEYTNLQPGDKGTVNHVDDTGTIFVNWDSGSKLGLIPGIDLFDILTD